MNLRNRNFLIIIMILVLGVLFGETPPPGADDILDLANGMQAGGDWGSGQRPSGRRTNPSILAELDATILEAGYVGLVESTISEGLAWNGHALGVTVVSPLSRGSLGFVIDFTSLNSKTMDLGSRLNLGVTWARMLPSGLQVGAGLHGGFGGANGNLDWSLGADLGISQRILLESWAEEVFWGASITSLGKELEPISGRSASISPFTPRVGGMIGLGNRELIYFTPGLFIEFPKFQNVRLDLSAGFQFLDFISLDVAWGFDLRQLLDSSNYQRPLFPRFGVSVQVPIRDERPKESRIEDRRTFGLSAAPWTETQWGIGIHTILPLSTRDFSGPHIAGLPRAPVYLSPNNDGREDRVTFSLEFLDPSGISKAGFEIFDQDSHLVYSELRVPEDVTTNEPLFSYLFGKPDNLGNSQDFIFSGRGQDNDVLPDGSYSLLVSAWDQRGNKSFSLLDPIIIDSLAPELSIIQPSPEERIFSPNDDGNKDTYWVEVSGSVEPFWIGSLRNSSGLIVRNLDFSGSAPSPFEWDGRDNRGEKVPDGVYEFQITGTDYAGNSTSGELTNLIVNTYVDPVRLQISRRAFSPNTSGPDDQLVFFPEVSRQQGIVNWQIEIENSTGETMRTLSGRGAPSDRILFDGNKDDGSQLPDGDYTADLSVFYQNGNVPGSTSPRFTIDRIAPFALTALEWSIMSPGVQSPSARQTMLFYQDASEEEVWEGQILDQDGQVVFTQIWTERAPGRFEWNGLDLDTSSVSDGIYTYVLSSEDRAGNQFSTDPLSFSIDTSSAEYRLGLSTRAFSPNADGIRDNVEISLTQQQRVPITSYSLLIMDSKQSVVRSFFGGSILPPRILWDGKDNSGFPVPDGVYLVNLDVVHGNGTGFQGSIGPILLDTEYPKLRVASSTNVFSPNDDERLDTIELVGSSDTPETLRGTIVNSEGEVVLSRTFSGTSASITWDGTNEIGNIVADGLYRYRLEATDSAGNFSAVSSDPFLLDTRVATAFVTLGSRGFSPNDDGLFDTIEIGMFLNLLEGLESWTLSIRDAQGNRVMEFSDQVASESMTVEWDGIGVDGSVRPGTYRAVFGARYQKGDAPESISQEFILDREGPLLRVLAAPQPFSPDDDGVDDEVQFTIQASDSSGIAGWSLEIFDRTGALFQEYGGRGEPPTNLLWDGVGKNGENVLAAEDYPYRVSVVDSFGNQSSVQSQVVTDIFVTRDGEKLYIQIANITFEPNSPVLVTNAESAVGIRNTLILDRLVQLFDRYPNYRIRIEGHAVNISGTEREQVQELVPLAERRASSVKNSLVERGMNSNRIDILGVGGARPIVPHTDLENRWKNRRVEFVLER